MTQFKTQFRKIMMIIMLNAVAASAQGQVTLFEVSCEKQDDDGNYLKVTITRDREHYESSNAVFFLVTINSNPIYQKRVQRVAHPTPGWTQYFSPKFTDVAPAQLFLRVEDRGEGGLIGDFSELSYFSKIPFKLRDLTWGMTCSE